MDWDVRLANRARRVLEGIPARDRGRIGAALLEMQHDPMGGDTRPLQGRHQGAFRRVGSWRIIFALKPKEHIVLIADITRRTSTTY